MFILSHGNFLFNLINKKNNSFKKQIVSLRDTITLFEKNNINYSNLTGKQLNVIKKWDTNNLESYLNKINEIKNAENSNNSALFDSLQIQEYASALKDVDFAQAALLLSTQGLSNAQILETLTARGLTTEQKYQAMMDAGLLKSKQSLTNVELQSSIAKTLSASMSREDAAAKAAKIMSSIDSDEIKHLTEAMDKLVNSPKMASN